VWGEVPSTQTTAIMGPSGAGVSTEIMSFCGLSQERQPRYEHRSPCTNSLYCRYILLETENIAPEYSRGSSQLSRYDTESGFVFEGEDSTIGVASKTNTLFVFSFTKAV